MDNASGSLDRSEQDELRSAGFSEDEIDAVARSVDASRILGVKSFVDEANDGLAAAGGAVRRESHGKHQGCLRARFDVTTDTGIGIFRPGTSYAAWIRLSNGGAYQRDDRAEHISRGFAIKLLNVADTATRTHDFLFITSPRFFIRDLTHYPPFLTSSAQGRPAQFLNFILHMSKDERDVIQHRRKLKVSNLLESPGYSAVPYRYGQDVVKYAIAPCTLAAPPVMPEPHAPPPDATEDYLEEAMNSTLQASQPDGVCFNFFIQRKTESDSIDDPTRAWEGPFEPVARFVIPFGQHRGGPFDYKSNDAVAESLSFDPFNATTDNRPVGRTNLTRKFVYAKLAAFRRRELPELFARWKQNRSDPNVPDEIRNELKNLAHPDAVRVQVQTDREPDIDDGFRALGIVSPSVNVGAHNGGLDTDATPASRGHRPADTPRY
jgi:hypothetical protein